MMRTAAMVTLATLAMLGGCTCEDEKVQPAASGAPASSPAPVFAEASSFTIADRPFRLPKQTSALETEAAKKLLPPNVRAIVALESAGEAPHRVYRYQARVGDRAELLVDVDITLSVDSEDGARPMPVPSLRLALEVTVEARSPRIQLGLRIARIVLSGEEEAGAIAAEMKPVLARLEGASSRMELSDRGAVRSPAPPADDAAVQQLWSSVAEALADSVLPLPAAAIGTGARWRVLDRVTRAGVLLFRETEVTASPQPKGWLALDATVREVAVAAGARDPSLAAEVRLQVLDGVSTGRRRLALSADAPWPRVSATELASDVTMRALAAPAGPDARESTVHLTEVLAVVRADLESVDAGGDAAQGGGDGS